MTRTAQRFTLAVLALVAAAGVPLLEQSDWSIVRPMPVATIHVLVLLSASEADARNKAGQIRQAFLESAVITKLPDGVDLSIGCVPVPPETQDFDPLIDHADREMYRRKRTLAS